MTDTTAPPAAGATTPDTGLADHVQRADANGIEIAYETFGDPADPAILLVMGLGTQMLAWRDDMCTALADAGHFVIRYDNRDVGLSTHIDAPVPKLTDMVLKRGAPTPSPTWRTMPSASSMPWASTASTWWVPRWAA